MGDNTQRVVTHRAMAPVARLMGYTVQGLIELCDAAMRISQEEWRTIGITRKDAHRVSVRRATDGRYEFSVGPNAFQLTENEQQAQRIRREMADEIVKRIKAQRPNDVRTIVRAAALRTDGSEDMKDQVSEDVGANLSKIISPYAPRDHTSR